MNIIDKLTIKAAVLEGRGKIVAFTSVINNGGMAIGIAAKGERGYYPTHITYDTKTEADAIVDKLNREVLNLDPTAAFKIVLSSMAL